LGATVVHGETLAKSEAGEIVPIKGDCCFPSYSTVAEAVKICERHGIPLDSWPIYYEPHVEKAVWEGHIPLDEVSCKCLHLRQQLGGIDGEIVASNWFLKRVWGWLCDGEVFCVSE
jgi:hypothetical protein